MKTLNIVFTKSKKRFAIGSWIIMLYTRKPYSHVAKRRYVEKHDVTLFFQSSESKVHYESEKYFNKKHHIVSEYEIPICEEINEKIMKECLRECGNEYALWQNIGIVIVDILNFLGIRAANPFKSGRNCSELIYTVALKKLIPDLQYNENTIKPHQIEEIIIKHFPDSKIK